MSLELVHSSVERGLRGGHGFATVVATAGMPPELEKILAELSAYDFDENRALGADTVEWAHRVVSVRGRSHTVLTRVAPCGADQSGRGNRVAHHVALDPVERCEAGPAWSLEHFGAFALSPPAPEERDTGPVVASGSLAPRRAMAWEALGLDPAWAGVVARTVLDTPVAPIYLVLPRESALLGAMVDVASLLPPERRWLFTFTTRYQRSHGAAKCQVRCVRAGAPGLAALRGEPGAKFIECNGDPFGEPATLAAGRVGHALVAAAIPSLAVRPVLMPPSTAARVEPSRMDPAERSAAREVTRNVDPAPPGGPEIGVVSELSDAPSRGRDRAPLGRPASSAGWSDPIVLALLVYSVTALAAAAFLLLAK